MTSRGDTVGPEVRVARRERILGVLRAALVEKLHVRREPEHIDMNAPLFGTGLALDSVDAVELAVIVETSFGVSLPDDAVARRFMRTVGTLVDYVACSEEGRSLSGLEGYAGDWDMSADESVPAAYFSLERELSALRLSTALLAPNDGLVCLRITGPRAFEAVDRLVSCDVTMGDAQTRDGLLLDDEAHIVADVTVARADEDFLLLADGASRPALLEHLGARLLAGAELQDALSVPASFVSLHGPYAWELLADAVDVDLVALPYASFVPLTRGGLCFRGGKTGEYGYDLYLPAAERVRVLAGLREVGQRFDLADVSQEAIDQCALENGFFCARVEGRAGLDPIELGLEWRLSGTKAFVGSEAIARLRERGHARRVAHLLVRGAVAPGDAVLLDGTAVGHVVRAGYAALRRDWVALALLDVTWAHAGLDLAVAAAAGPVAARSVAAPVIDNRSLYVSPQRHGYASRRDDRFPPLGRALP